ncbi:hypothetical protein B2A_11219, partial [mine drainage metagenome]
LWSDARQPAVATRVEYLSCADRVANILQTNVGKLAVTSRYTTRQDTDIIPARRHYTLQNGTRGNRPNRTGIQETLMLYQAERGRPRARRMLTEIDPIQRRLYDLFGLDSYAPKR